MRFEYTTMVPAVYVDVAHTCRCGILRNDGLLIGCLRRSQDGYPDMPSILFLHLVLTHSLRCGEPVSGIICKSTHSKKCGMSKRIIREESQNNSTPHGPFDHGHRWKTNWRIPIERFRMRTTTKRHCMPRATFWFWRPPFSPCSPRSSPTFRLTFNLINLLTL